jgi:hypothetical protein
MQAVFNRHSRDFRCSFTIEFDVKLPDLHLLKEEHIELMEHEYSDGFLTNYHAEQCFDEIMESDYGFVTDWSFAGRSGGWFVLTCDGEESKVRASSLRRIERIVEKYFKGYGKFLATNFDSYLKEQDESVS